MNANKQKGFTLIELLIVISITIILAGATIPVFGGWQAMTRPTMKTREPSSDL